MGLSSANRVLGKVAAILGILQGLAWTFMSVIAIILYYWKSKLDGNTTYTRIIESILYHKFIFDDGTLLSETTFIITPTNFNIAMWIYFVLSILWCSLSLDQFTAIHYKRSRQSVLIRIWGIGTLILSAVDLAFVVLLGTDYVACGGNETGVTEPRYFCYLSVGIVMTLAARGYTLWLINIVFSIILIRASVKVENEDINNESLYSTIPRAKLSRPAPQRY